MHKTTSQRETIPTFLKYSIMNMLQNSPFLTHLMNNSTVHELKYDLSCELYRISTFSNFPPNVPVSERSLARAGFFYTGLHDKVKCFSCGLMLDNWKKGDDALEKHKQLYPSCNFLQGLHSASNLGSSSHSAFSPPAASSLLQPMPSTSFSSNFDRTGYFSKSYASFPQDPVTSQGAEDLSHLRSNHCNPSLSTEEARLSTFKTWTVPFLSPSELAKAGFFYTGPGDRVTCFTCGGQLNNWEPKDNALSEHRRHFPNCSFLDSLMTEQSRLNVTNVGMQTYAARLKTFINWPSRIPVRPEQLASAGFYYVGRNDDVKCFCCDGGLRCWESGDDPWIEHAKWFPRCEYLLMIKKPEFVDQIQARFPHLLEQLYSTSDTPVNETSEGTIFHLDPGEYNQEDAVMMNTAVVKSALEMGFSMRLVKQTVQSKILATNENYKTINELVSDLVTAKEEKDEEEHEKRAEVLVENSLKYTPTEDISGLPMEEQLRRLQEERTCKVCMDKEVSIVFIPCGHLVVCKECAPSLRKCPICRGTIKGTVRTFLS